MTKPSQPVANALLGAILALTCVASWYIPMMPISTFRWFSYHPLFMLIGTCSFVSSAVIKKLGGYANTKLHGMLALVGTVAYYVGFYVIWVNKEDNSADHFTTNHSYSGGAALMLVTALLTVGLVALHPDFGALKTHKMVRLLHKSFGALAILLSLYTVYTGVATVSNEPVVLNSLIAGLVVFGGVVVF